MPRNYTKMKHLEPIVFARKRLGCTNAEIAAELGLTIAQIKGLIKRHNRRGRAYEEDDFEQEANCQQPELDETLERMCSEVDELQAAIQLIERKWEQITASRKTDHKE